MTTTRRLVLSVDVASAEMLEQVGNKSSYLSAVIRQRWSEWQGAITLLLADGWKTEQLIDACNRLVGFSDASPRSVVTARLLLTKGTMPDAEVEALLIVSLEYWAGNAALREAIGAAGKVLAKKAAAR